jgi:queuine tRNA-ribosyltransferase
MLASYHNLYFLHNMIKEVRQAINEDRFEEYKTNFMKRYQGK